MEKVYKFTIEDIEDMISRMIYGGKDTIIFHWNFEINEPKPINDHIVLVVDQKEAKIPNHVIYSRNEG